MVRKHCGKVTNCSYRAISPFPTVFSKDVYYRHVKARACLGKVELCTVKNLYFSELLLSFFKTLYKS